MKWNCPVCGRGFKTKNQWHSCYTASVEDHLQNKPKWIIDMFDEILSFSSELGKIELNPVKTSIQLRAGATFLGIKLKKTKIELEFFSKNEIEHPTTIKNLRISANRVFNEIVLNNENSFNEEIRTFIRESYKLVIEANDKT